MTLRRPIKKDSIGFYITLQQNIIRPRGNTLVIEDEPVMVSFNVEIKNPKFRVISERPRINEETNWYLVEEFKN